MSRRQMTSTWCLVCLAVCASLPAAKGEPRERDAGPADSPAAAVPGEESLTSLPPSMSRTVNQVFALFPDANREDVLVFIREQLPHEMRRLREMSERHVGDAFGLTIDLVQDALRLLEMRKEDPALYQKVVQRRNLERLADDLAVQCRRSAGSERQESEVRLRETLTRCFEIKQELMRRDLAQMERELGELKTLIEKREASRKDIINRRIIEVTGQTEHLEW